MQNATRARRATEIGARSPLAHDCRRVALGRGRASVLLRPGTPREGLIRPLSYREAVHEPHGTDDLAGAVIGVVGAGTMGAGIAQVALEAGHEVVLYDVDEQALEAGVERVRVGLGRRAAKLELDADSIDEWVDGRLANLRTAVTLDAVASAADIAIEAALEDLDLKRTIFGALDREAPPDALLATNTSALSVAAIAVATSRPEHVLGLHFFNPAPLMPLVEVVRAPQTDGDSVKRAVALMERWGKTPVVAEDAPGFIVNRVNRPFTLEALAMLEAGEAGIPEIDAARALGGLSDGPVRADGPHGHRRDPRRQPAGSTTGSWRGATRWPIGSGPRRCRSGWSRPAGSGARRAPGSMRTTAGWLQTCRRLRARLRLIRLRCAASGPLEPSTRDRIVERIELAIVERGVSGARRGRGRGGRHRSGAAARRGASGRAIRALGRAAAERRPSATASPTTPTRARASSRRRG